MPNEKIGIFPIKIYNISTKNRTHLDSDRRQHNTIGIYLTVRNRFSIIIGHYQFIGLYVSTNKKL